MRYETKEELPEKITAALPDEAQEIYLRRYQEAWDNYNPRSAGGLPRQALAHREGWAAVGREFEQHEGTGAWYRRGEVPADPGGGSTIVDRLREALGV